MPPVASWQDMMLAHMHVGQKNSLLLCAEVCVAVRSNTEVPPGINRAVTIWIALFALRQINKLTQFESFSFFKDLKGE